MTKDLKVKQLRCDFKSIHHAGNMLWDDPEVLRTQKSFMWMLAVQVSPWYLLL